MCEAGVREPLTAQHARHLGDAHLAGNSAHVAQGRTIARLLGDDEMMIGTRRDLGQVIEKYSEVGQRLGVSL